MDSNNCVVREDIWVYVDSCVTDIDASISVTHESTYTQISSLTTQLLESITDSKYHVSSVGISTNLSLTKIILSLTSVHQ